MKVSSGRRRFETSAREELDSLDEQEENHAAEHNPSPLDRSRSRKLLLPSSQSRSSQTQLRLELRSSRDHLPVLVQPQVRELDRTRPFPVCSRSGRRVKGAVAVRTGSEGFLS